MWWENWNKSGQKLFDNVTLISLSHLKNGSEQNCPLNKNDEARFCDEVGPTAQLCSTPSSEHWKLGRMCWAGQDAWRGCPETGLFTLAGTPTESETMLGRSNQAVTRGNFLPSPAHLSLGAATQSRYWNVQDWNVKASWENLTLTKLILHLEQQIQMLRWPRSRGEIMANLWIKCHLTLLKCCSRNQSWRHNSVV